MNKIVNSFKNYLLNKSNQYHYYKSGYAQLKQDNFKLNAVLKDLNHKIDENIQLKQDIAKLEDDINILTYNLGDHLPDIFILLLMIVTF